MIDKLRAFLWQYAPILFWPCLIMFWIAMLGSIFMMVKKGMQP